MVLSNVGAAGLVGDRGHFLLLLGHSGEQRGQIIAVLDPREIGRLERQRARLRERVRRGQRRGCGGLGFGRRGEHRLGGTRQAASAADVSKNLRIISFPNISIG